VRPITVSLLMLAAACGGSAGAFDPIKLKDVPNDVVKICGDSAILGKKVAPVSRGACGIAAPVRVYAVSGVRLSAQPLVNCKTAKALNNWVTQKAGPITASAGERLAKLNVVASYACRTRNHQPGAKLSEHARGNAIDIAAVEFESGKRLTVLNDWGKGRDGKLLAAYHSGACGIFGTVLGPKSDRFHQDHFHFDTANYSRPYCR